PPRSDGGIACCPPAAPAHSPRSELSPLCRSAHIVRRAEFLERRFQPSLHCGGSRWTVEVSSQRGNLRDLPRDISDRLWLLVLSLAAKRQFAVVGPAADDALLYRDPRFHRRGARQRKIGCRAALAARGNGRAQSDAVAPYR